MSMSMWYTCITRYMVEVEMSGMLKFVIWAYPTASSHIESGSSSTQLLLLQPAARRNGGCHRRGGRHGRHHSIGQLAGAEAGTTSDQAEWFSGGHRK